MKEKPNYYAILTAEVRYNKDLTPNAKLLFAEITALENMNGQCFASNRYFADLYGKSKTSISLKSQAPRLRPTRSLMAQC